jgi:hypothetical protein
MRSVSMNRRSLCLGTLLLFASASSLAAPNAAAPPLPLVVELELANDAHAQQTLFAVIDELGLRVPLERVREPFRCSASYMDNERGQAIQASCDPTQRTASRVANYLDPTRPDFLSFEPRHCSEDCVRQPLSVRRLLVLRLPIRGQVADAPCPEAMQTTSVDFRFETRWHVGYGADGVQARLPFLFLTTSSPAVAVPVSRNSLRSTKCAANPSQNQLQVTCGEQVFVAQQTGNRISFDDGGPRGALVLPCGKLARWPKSLPDR